MCTIEGCRSLLSNALSLKKFSTDSGESCMQKTILRATGAPLYLHTGEIKWEQARACVRMQVSVSVCVSQ